MVWLRSKNAELFFGLSSERDLKVQLFSDLIFVNFGTMSCKMSLEMAKIFCRWISESPVLYLMTSGWDQIIHFRFSDIERDNRDVVRFFRNFLSISLSWGSYVGKIPVVSIDVTMRPNCLLISLGHKVFERFQPKL